MSKKTGKRYSADFKAKIVLELLEGEKPLNQLCSEHGLTPKSVQSWKAAFIKNAGLAFNIEGAVSEYKQSIKDKEAEIEDLHRQLGKRSAELEWASKKLKSLGCKEKKALIDPKLSIPVVRQCELLNYQRSQFYYKPVGDNKNKTQLLKAIDEVYTECPFYGYRKVHVSLLEQGYTVGVNRVRDYMRELGLKVIYPTKQVQTTLANIQHKKYPYLLRDIQINRPNQVWSTDLTYIRLNGGFVYLAAIIDWYSKAILAHKISNTMDSQFVTGVLEKAISQYGTPEIFNTDQGSQYTSEEHTNLLLSHGIKISMDGKGRATDNIAIERFWRSAKQENIYLYEYDSMKDLRQGMSQYIDFYNERRFHQTLNYKKPMDVYLNHPDDTYKLAA